LGRIKLLLHLRAQHLDCRGNGLVGERFCPPTCELCSFSFLYMFFVFFFTLVLSIIVCHSSKNFSSKKVYIISIKTRACLPWAKVASLVLLKSPCIYYQFKYLFNLLINYMRFLSLFLCGFVNVKQQLPKFPC